jgi:hypothetical protein
MTYDQAFEIGKWIGGTLLFMVILALAARWNRFTMTTEREAAERRAEIRTRRKTESPL